MYMIMWSPENLLQITIIFNLINKEYLKLSSATPIPDGRYWKFRCFEVLSVWVYTSEEMCNLTLSLLSDSSVLCLFS